jgi:Flp pilus assembly protein TadB
MEPWLWMVMASLLPVLVAFVVPRTYHVALFVASGVLFVAAMAVVIGQQRRKRRRDSQP